MNKHIPVSYLPPATNIIKKVFLRPKFLVSPIKLPPTSFYRLIAPANRISGIIACFQNPITIVASIPALIEGASCKKRRKLNRRCQDERSVATNDGWKNESPETKNKLVK